MKNSSESRFSDSMFQQIPWRNPCFSWDASAYPTLFDYLEGGETLGDFLQGFPTVARDSAVASLEEAKHLLPARS